MAVPVTQAPAVSSASLPPLNGVSGSNGSGNGNSAAPTASAPLRRSSVFSTSSGDAPSNEQVARWIAEYVRRRDLAGTDAGRGRGSDLPVHELKARIAHHYSHLVESVARRFHSSGEPFEDLVQEGFLGLLSALEHYDHVKGVKFSTYATHFVAGSIRHCLRDRGKIIKEPAWLHDLHGKISRTSDQLTQTLGRAPHPGEIAQVLNLAEESVEEILATRQVFQVAAFASASDGENGESMAGLVDPDKIRSDKPQTLRLPIEDRIVLEETASKLKKLEQDVLYEFFYKDLNQTEIARKFGISCNYVSHILKNSTKKLRKMMGEVDVRERMNDGDAVSVVDRATSLYTQAHTLARFDEEISRASRAATSVAALVIRLDGLLPLAGHKRDEVLTQLGEAVKKGIRRRDIAGRFEEDSLLVILPQTGQQAQVVADRLEDVLLAAGAALHQKFFPRIGMAVFPEQGRAARELLQIARADAQMPTDERPAVAFAAAK